LLYELDWKRSFELTHDHYKTGQNDMDKRLEIIVRFASSTDHDVVSSYNYIANVGGAEVVRRMIERQQVVIAEQDGQPAGYAYFDYLGVLTPFLAMIWVFEEHRGRGVSRYILRFLEAYFRERDHDMLYSSSQVDQPEPQAWHRHMGFEECGFIMGTGSDGVGEVYFRKRLRGVN
jgi:GNAT superfamily N-acetyltransferase